MSNSTRSPVPTPVERETVESTFRRIQEQLCTALESVDRIARFRSDAWERPGGGGGLTRVLEGSGNVEKAAVNFSSVEGESPPSESLATGSHFYATGISVIVHPFNPHAPTFHANLRYFETDDGRRWFGGGADLTPHYLYEDDARHFHSVLRRVCSAHPVARYAEWKEACDEYFRLPHRGEARGVGGIFFDHLNERLEEVWAFVVDLGAGLGDAYLPLLQRRMTMPFDEREKTWQLIRRGRYAEFNLVWDRGTRFGLETSGRIESILASLPPRATWIYAHEPETGTAEAELLETLRSKPREWA